MKLLKSIYFSLIFATLSLSSCNQYSEVRGEDFPDNMVFGQEIEREKDFVWRALNSWYFWQKDVPKLSDDFRKSPQYLRYVSLKKTDELFYDLLFKFGEVDRNSWIMLDGIMQGKKASSNTMATVSTGFDYTILNDYPDKIALVNYVVPGSAAKKAGLKRGDVIIKVNGNWLTNNNIRQLNSNQNSITVALNPTVDGQHVRYSGEAKYNLVASNVNEDPIHHCVAWNNDGVKVGYLMYNGFESAYNGKLNSYFGFFKSQGVKELILDLRYNGGGSVKTAVALAQMITGQFKDHDFVKLEFNHKHAKENSTLKMTDEISVAGGVEKINSLKLTRVYVLTSRGTASASEIVIKCLKPYINVIMIGDKTYGKYVGSITLYDSPDHDFTDSSKRNRAHKWSLQPITFAYYDIYKTPTVLNEGMEPDHRIPNFKYIGTMKELQNEQGHTIIENLVSDPAVEKALELIHGASRARLSRMTRSIPIKDFEFVASRKTLTPFGTDVYLEKE